MIKVLYGIQLELIEDYINKFISDKKINNVIKYNYEEIEITSLVEECSYLDLFGDTKLVILYNSKFLGSKETIDNKIFNDYLLNPNPNTFLFLVLNEENIDERKKVIKLIKEKYETLEFNSFTESDAIRYIKESFKKDNYIIEEAAIRKMFEYLQTNYGLYNNEIKKLKLYKLDDKNITLDDVINVTSRVPEDNIFKLLDAVIVNNKEEIFKLYKDIKSIGADEIAILALISSQFRFMYQVCVLSKDGKNKFEIAKYLNAHPYKTEMILKKINLYKEEKILDILLELSEIDIKIKTGEQEKSSILEDFFLKL